MYLENFVIRGGHELFGEVNISGAKNAAVAIIPAAILANDVVRIENIPNISDVSLMIQTLDRMGAKIKLINNNTIEIDSRSVTYKPVPYELASHFRASYYLIGVMLGRFKKAEVAMPGGCDFGVRPIDQHIKGFEMLGATVETIDGMVCANADKLVGASIYMDVNRLVLCKIFKLFFKFNVRYFFTVICYIADYHNCIGIAFCNFIKCAVYYFTCFGKAFLVASAS